MSKICLKYLKTSKLCLKVSKSVYKCLNQQKKIVTGGRETTKNRLDIFRCIRHFLDSFFFPFFHEKNAGNGCFLVFSIIAVQQTFLDIFRHYLQGDQTFLDQVQKYLDSFGSVTLHFRHIQMYLDTLDRTLAGYTFYFTVTLFTAIF